MSISMNDLGRNWQRLFGIGTILVGLFVLSSPFLLSNTIITALGVLLLIIGVFSFFANLRAPDEAQLRSNYLQSVVTILLGVLLLFSPNLVLSGLVSLVSLFYLIEGITKIYAGLKASGKERFGNVYNGLFSILLGLLIWYFVSVDLGVLAVVIFVGLRLLAEGWRLLFLAKEPTFSVSVDWDLTHHIDPAIVLEANRLIEPIQKERYQLHLAARGQLIDWNITLLLIFFFIHMARTGGNLSILGVITPFSAVIGDILVAFLVALVVVLPFRLLWRSLTHPLERASWRYLLQLNKAYADYSLGEKLLRFWLVHQMDFSIQLHNLRNSLQYAFWRILSLGIPATAMLIAINSIWGFSWYFNSENWASAVWQKITEGQVDTWRQSMAIKAEEYAVSQGIDPSQVYAIAPEGADATGDFSFIVIGDPGEGDESQLALIEQFLKVGSQEDVKFAIISSDVIYPDGRMRDYEKNFYLPFKGFYKPLYAIPGNHDWFDSNQGFIANFFEPESALISLNSRLDNDIVAVDPLADQSHQELVAEAQRLRSLYHIQNGLQRASYFELQSTGFSLIAVDTGILRTIDDKQKEWLEAALQRAGDNFKFVILGHPFYAAGADQTANDAAFSAIHELLRTYQVNVVMAGDTHDFEFYRELYQQDDKANEMLHFVNGGGGAYLSIGTALDFPKEPVTDDFAFYPATDTLLEKLDSETPGWKRPILSWIKRFHGYPMTTETLSGIFDFNNAPFFQSFMEIRFERSKNQVRMLLYGVDGQLQWKDLQLGGAVKPVNHSEEDFVEFVRPLHKK